MPAPFRETHQGIIHVLGDRSHRDPVLPESHLRRQRVCRNSLHRDGRLLRRRARCGNLMLRTNRTPPANLPANPPANVQLRELRELRRGHGTASGAPGIDGFERRNPTTTKSTALTFTGSRVTPQWLRGDSWSEKFDHRTWRRFHRFSCSAIILWPTSSWTDHGAPAACWAFA